MENPTEFEKLANQQFESLPVEVKNAINSVDWRAAIKNISRQNNLDSSQEDELTTETMIVLYGLEGQEDFIQKVAELGLDREKSKTISEQIERDVFSKVITALEATSNEKLLEEPRELGAPIAQPKQEEAPTITSFYKLQGRPLDFNPDKPKLAEAPAIKMNSYPGGVDPYREATT